MTILFIILAIVYLAVAWQKPAWALLGLIALLPSYLFRANLGGLPLTFLEVMILISFAVWLLKNFLPDWKNIFKNRAQRIPYPYAIEIILLLVISLAAVAVAGFGRSSLGIWKAYFFEPILLYILIYNYFPAKENRIKILWALLISAGAVSLFAIFQKMTGLFITNPFWAAAATRRSVSFFGYPNAVGLYLAPLILIFSGWLWSLDWKNRGRQMTEKIIIAVVISCSVLAIYFARSEGALIGLVVGGLVLALAGGQRAHLGLAILVLLAFAGLAVSPPTRSYLIEKFTLHDLSGEIRQQQWKETFKMLETNNRLITGAGLDNYSLAIKPFHQEGIFYNSDQIANFDAVVWASPTLRTKYWQPVEIYMYPHNIFLNFWSELGIFGLLIFTWLIGKHLFICWKLSRQLSLNKIGEPASGTNDKYFISSLAAAMVVILVHGLVDVPYFKNDLAAMFWILIALGGLANLNQRQELGQNKASDF